MTAIKKKNNTENLELENYFILNFPLTIKK